MAANRSIIAVAGALKTQAILDEALSNPDRRVLITTFTNENLSQIRRRIEATVGVVPYNVELKSWFSFLIQDAIRPFQVRLFDEINLVSGLYFDDIPEERLKVKKEYARGRYLTGGNRVFRDRASELACQIEEKSPGETIGRLEKIYDHILIDEVQDLVAYDIEFLDALFRSSIDVTIVGDPRQCTYSTNRSPKNKKYRGMGFLDWLKEREDLCEQEIRAESYRCGPAICELASKLFPNETPLTAKHTWDAPHVGVHYLTRDEVVSYVEAHAPIVLRPTKSVDTMGLSAMNIGVAKGSTFEHVLIFPNGKMVDFLNDNTKYEFGTRQSLYIGLTRAKHSVGIVL